MEDSRRVFSYGLYYGRVKFCCKATQFCAKLCEPLLIAMPSIRNGLRRCKNLCNPLGFNQTTIALPAELSAQILRGRFNDLLMGGNRGLAAPLRA